MLYRFLLIAAGSVNVALGVIGIFLPVMPSTVFFLIAAACYVRSSPALYSKLIHHKRIGPLIYNYRTHRAMPRKAKKQAIAVLWITIGFSAFMVQKPLVWAILGTVVLGVSAIILTTKSLEDIPASVPESDGNS